jgi:tRNA uridine 5-carbamoylmethylation protein Kti12
MNGYGSFALNRLLTQVPWGVAQAALAFGTSEKTIQRWTKEGTPSKIHAEVLYRLWARYAECEDREEFRAKLNGCVTAKQLLDMI